VNADRVTLRSAAILAPQTERTIYELFFMGFAFLFFSRHLDFHGKSPFFVSQFYIYIVLVVASSFFFRVSSRLVSHSNSPAAFLPPYRLQLHVARARRREK
jgi:hypothetical protein